MKIEAGQWWETRNSGRAHILYVATEEINYPVFAVLRLKKGDLFSETLSRDGKYYAHASANVSDLITRLPDCTGWDWEPPKPVEPGEGWRLLEDHEVVRGDDEREYSGTEPADWMWESIVDTIGQSCVGNTVATCRERFSDLVIRRRIQPDVPADWQLIGGVPGGMLYFKPTEAT